MGLRHDIDPGLEVVADSDRIGQVGDNLLSNAVKFTPAPDEVSVHLHRTAAGVDLTVQDTGIGVPAEDLDSVGTRFFRTRNATELAIPGVGLGLLLTKSIVTAHGGQLDFVSREGQGTTVCVFLPSPGQTPGDRPDLAGLETHTPAREPG